MFPWVLLGGFLVVAGGGAAVAIATTGNRRKVTSAPADAAGVVRADPGELAQRAGVSLAVYALARMIASEAGGQSATARAAVAWAALNYARRGKRDIAAVLLAGRGDGNGRFASQEWGKYASTSRDPTAEDVDIARRVMSGEIPDPTGGATQWDSPRAQRALAKKKPGIYRTPEEVAANRRKAGSALVLVAGVPEETIRFWRPA